MINYLLPAVFVLYVILHSYRDYRTEKMHKSIYMFLSFYRLASTYKDVFYSLISIRSRVISRSLDTNKFEVAASISKKISPISDKLDEAILATSNSHNKSKVQEVDKHRKLLDTLTEQLEKISSDENLFNMEELQFLKIERQSFNRIGSTIISQNLDSDIIHRFSENY